MLLETKSLEPQSKYINVAKYGIIIDLIVSLSLCKRKPFRQKSGMDKQNISHRIKSIRTKTGLSQEELGELVGRSVDTISAIERGKNFPNYETLNKLASAFGLSVETLLNEDDDTMPLERAQLIAEINVSIGKADERQLKLIRDLVTAAMRNS